MGRQEVGRVSWNPGPNTPNPKHILGRLARGRFISC